MLQGKKILLGVCGSIAAYKTAFLTRLLVKEGAEVKIIMTTSAAEFITPLTLSTLSKNPVLQHFTHGKEGEWNNHVELGLWADLLIIAPASANTIAKMASGLCDNLLMATYLSARCNVVIAPSMDLDMYAQPSTKRNLDVLRSDGVKIIDVEDGELASGLSGTGRMSEPEHILGFIKELFTPDQRFFNKKVLVTAGPTYEPIDPVRFIGNHSSGKMGYSIANKFASLGAKVTLVSGPTKDFPIHKGIEIIKVDTAKEMNDKCLKLYPETDIAVLAAAVADFTPQSVASQKIKKTSEDLTISLTKTPDIAKNLGEVKRPGQINVGFALETQNELHNAQEKLKKKNFDLIILNSLNDSGAGFGHDTNKVTIIDKQNNVSKFELKNKKEVAKDIIDAIAKIIP